MYSASFSALISGIVTGMAIAIGGAIQVIGSSTPDPLPVAFIAGALAVAALLAGAFVAVAVRSGLRLARCQRLAARFALIIAATNVTVLAILGAAPVETHAIKFDMPSGSSSPAQFPLTFWLIIALTLLVPVFVAYVVGRIARGRASAA